MKRTKHVKRNPGNLVLEMASLPDLDHPALVEKWRSLYGTEPPVRVRSNFLMCAIAHRMQEQVIGGLPPVARRYLEKAAEEGANMRDSGVSGMDGMVGRKKMAIFSPTIKPGTRLLREWHGKTHEVIVTEEGVRFNGKSYRSLSEVARTITGTRWSGPLFFGLKSADKGRAA